MSIEKIAELLLSTQLRFNRSDLGGHLPMRTGASY
jgi:hypothetical protein